MKQFDELSLLEIVDEVKDGDLIGIPADYSGVPMMFTKELIKKGVNINTGNINRISLLLNKDNTISTGKVI